VVTNKFLYGEKSFFINNREFCVSKVTLAVLKRLDRSKGKAIALEGLLPDGYLHQVIHHLRFLFLNSKLPFTIVNVRGGLYKLNQK
jgi:hypothetical protein